MNPAAPGTDKVVWEYVLPGANAGSDQCENIDGVRAGSMFRSYRYAANYQGFAGHDLSASYPFPDCP